MTESSPTDPAPTGSSSGDGSDLPFGADTDEAVSAFVDGELADFAVARALSENQARLRLEAWPGFAARVAAFAAVRDHVGTVVPLDEVTVQRLVRGTRDESLLPAPRRPRSRVLVRIGVAAAVVVGVVAIGVALVTRGGDPGPQASTASRGPRNVPAAPRGFLGDLGDVTDPATLRALLGERASAPPTARAAAPTPDAAKHEAADASGTSSSRVDACAREIAGGAPVRFRAVGTFAGAPAVVVGVRRAGRTIVFVVPPDRCTQVLSSVSR
jgi:hypothetical protein